MTLTCSYKHALLGIFAEHISDRQIIVQQVRRYSKVVFVCTYVHKISGLLIVDSNCTDACALHRECHSYYHKLSSMKNV